MTPACQELAPLITLRAAGALEPAEARRVEAHLATCEACRAEADADADLLDLARLPPLSEPERRAAADLPQRTLAALHRTDRRRDFAKRLAAITVVAAAAVVMMVLLPALSLLHAPAVSPSAQAVAAWQEPDPDTLYEDTDMLDLDAASGGADGMTAALAAVEVADGG